jgi:hypothetical protein
MKHLDDMEKSFNELQEHSDIQFRTIIELKKQIEGLKEENKLLKSKNNNGLPQTVGDFSENPLKDISNEQLICETQLELLKERAIVRELTLEEAKKFQIYTVILSDIHKKQSDMPDLTVQKLSDDELLKLVVNNVEQPRATV